MLHKRFAKVDELLTARQPLLDLALETGIIDVDATLSDPSGPSEPEDEVNTPPILTDLFPDLNVYGGPSAPEEGRVHKRLDEGQTSSHRIAHTSRLIDIRPIFVSNLQPAKNFANGSWDLHDGPWFEDPSGSTDIPPEVVTSAWSVFSGRGMKPINPRSAPSVPVPAGNSNRHHHIWTDEEDALLIRLIQTYPFNWQLISDTFNSEVTSIPTDKPSAFDCWDRWYWKWGEGKGKPRPEVVAAAKTAQTPGGPTPAAPASAATPAGSANGTPAPSSAAPPSAVAPGRPAATPTAPTPGGGISVPTLPGQNGTEIVAEGAPPPPGLSKREAKQAGKHKYEGSKKSIRHQVLYDSMRRLVRRREQAKQKTAGESRFGVETFS